MKILKSIFGVKEEEEITFQFDSPKNEACFTCRHVLEEGKPILYVSHDEDDGAWQFLCGDESHEDADARIVALFQIVKMDPSVNALCEMPEGVCAERDSVGSEWKVYRNT